MIRIPLRPLAKVFSARYKGLDPKLVESANLNKRREQLRDKLRHRAEARLLVLAVFFFCGYALIGAQMGLLAASEPYEPSATRSGEKIESSRSDIVDRKGRVLATNISTHSLYAHPRQMIDPARAARELALIFPDLVESALYQKFTGRQNFLWVKRKISPEQKQAVFDIGEPGLLFGPRQSRLYPNGALAAHILGGARFGREDVNAAEVIGAGGVESAFDTFLRDPDQNGRALELSIDLGVQSIVEDVLAGGMHMMNAVGAAAVLMDVHTGELLSLVSLPDFDPNAPATAKTTTTENGATTQGPGFNRAVQGRYELGSTFKTFTTAQAIDLGLVNANTMVDANAPFRWGRFTINEFQKKNYGPLLSVRDVLVKSSNVGTANLALKIGGARQKSFFEDLGLLDATTLELSGASKVKPLYQSNWSEIVTITASYGHGISVSPVHLASAYATLTNGGTKVAPTLLKHNGPVTPGARVVSEQTSAQTSAMLRAVVTDGTASLGRVAGYEVGGKTGTADKSRPQGGYYDDKVIASFASVFPASDPKYVLVVMLDEPLDTTGTRPRRSAGWTAVPIAAEIIRRSAPVLGVKPRVANLRVNGVTLTSN